MSEITLKDLPEIPYEKPDYTPVDEGDYTLQISSFDVRVSQRTDKPYVRVCMTIKDPASVGRKVWKSFFPYNDNIISRNIFWSFVKAVTGKNLNRGFSPQKDFPNLLGRNLRARVTIETDPKGKERNDAIYFAIATDDFANAEYNPTDQATADIPAL